MKENLFLTRNEGKGSTVRTGAPLLPHTCFIGISSHETGQKENLLYKFILDIAIFIL